MTSASTFQIDSIQGRTVVSFLPHLNEIPWSEIEKVGGHILPKLQESPSPGVLVDLCALKYMGSASLALIVRIYKTVTEKRGRMIVANCDPMVGEVLAKAGLAKIWEIASSRDEGLRRLGLPTSEAVRRAGGWQNLIAIAGLLISAVGFAAYYTPSFGLAPTAAIGMQVGGGLLGFGFALWALLEGAGPVRTIGTMVLVVSVALLLLGVFNLAQPTGAKPVVTAEPARSVSKGVFVLNSIAPVASHPC